MVAATARFVREFLRTEAVGGLILVVAALAAMVWANSPWSDGYRSVWEAGLSIGTRGFSLTLDLRHWINDALMALFFFVIGLEIKRELIEGDLHDPRTAAVPALAALGGMAAPALIFLAATAGTAGARGWGIPMATDVAFAVGVVALLGSRVPRSLKLFLLTLAIVDDIGAVVVVAAFYTRDIRPGYLALALAILALTVGLYRAGLMWTPLLVVLALAEWLAVYESGVHATIAGVTLALAVPVRRTGTGPAGHRLEEMLHPVSTFAVVPLFALANAGVVIKAGILDAPGALPVALGVGLGLVIGKAVGIAGATWLSVRSGLGRLPEGSTWPMLFGIGLVAGIGFTVSLFVTDLAFASHELQDAAKLGILAAFVMSVAAGVLVLGLACRGGEQPGR